MTVPCGFGLRVPALRLLCLTVHTNQVGAMAFSPDSTLLVSGGGCLDNTLRVFSSSSLALLQTIVATVNGVTALAISPDSSMVASAGDASEQVIRLWSLKDGSLVRTLAGNANGTAVLAFSRTVNIWLPAAWLTTAPSSFGT